jgi:PAS domain S-box-containing protein
MIDELEKLRELTEILTSNGYLKDQAMEWEYALDSVSECVIIVNIKEEIRFINKPLLYKLGSDSKELFYSNSLSEITGDLNLKNFDINEKTEVFISMLDGWFECYKSPIFTASGKLIGYIVVLNEVTDRKIAELSLKHSEEKFRLAFSSSPDAVYITSFDDGTYTEVNKGFTDITGYTRDEVLGKSGLEFSIWYDIKDRDKLVKELNKRECCSNMVARFLKKDGGIFIGSLSASVVTINNKKHIISINRDITESKRLERLVIESEKRYRVLFEKSIDVMFLLDSEFSIIDFNRAAKEKFSSKAVNLIGSSILDVFEEFYEHNKIELFKEKLHSASKGNDELFEIVIRSNCEILYYLFRLNKIGLCIDDYILVTLIDLSDTKKMESEFGIVVDNLRDIVWTLDLNWNFTYVSPNVLDIMGYTVSEFLGSNLSDHTTEEEMEKMRKIAMDTITDNNVDIAIFRTKLKKKSGDFFDVEIHGKSILDDKNNVIGLHGVTVVSYSRYCTHCDNVDCPYRNSENCKKKESSIKGRKVKFYQEIYT